MKYFVIATRYDSKKENGVEFIAGEFDSRMNANIFRDAYNDFYGADAKVISSFDLLND